MARTSAGVFSGLGGDIVIKVDIVPKPEQIRSQLMMAAHNLDDTMKPMLAARRAAQEDIQAHFDSSSEPDGTGWTELNVDYLRYKESQGMSSEILRRTGALEKAAVSDQAFIVTAHGLWYNWDALPTVEGSDGEVNLGILQQRGTGGKKTGKAGTAGSIEELLAQTQQTTGEAGKGEGRGKNLPPRPFVGMSDFMAETFEQIFDVWFDEAVSVVVHPKTGIMQYATSTGFGRRVV